ncbi:MAG: diguanylate cyclase [Desulfovibrionaceae bacterium]
MASHGSANTALSMLVLCIVSVTVLIMSYGVWQDWQLVKHEQLTKTLHLAKLCAERQKTFTKITEILLRTLVNVPVIVQGNPDKISAFLKKLDVQQPDFAGFALFRPNGSAVVTTLNGEAISAPPPAIIRQRQYFTLAMEKRDFSVGEYLPAPSAPHVPTLAMSMPVEDSNGKISAVILAALDFRRYDTLISSIFGTTPNSVQIFDRKRVLMYAYHAETTELLGAHVQSPPLIALMNTPEPVQALEFAPPDGNAAMVAMVKLYTEGATDPYMYIYVQVPMPTPWDFITTRYLLELSAMCAALLLGLCAAYACGRVYFSDGLKKLALVAQSAQSGNYAVRIGAVSGCQEIHVLAESFDDMLNALEENTALLQHQRACLDFALDGGQMGTWEWDPAFNVCSLDARGLHLLGYTPQAFTNTDVRTLIHPDDKKLSQTNMKLHIEGALPFYHTELRLKHHEGHWMWASLQGRLGTSQPLSSPPRVFGILRDISQRKRIDELEQEKAEYYRRLSNTDVLTGLNNRRHFMEQAQLAMHQASRYGHTVAVVIADIDHFKQVNDKYGHATGDALLKSFGERLLKFMRQTDIVGRYGGEEFIFLLPQTSLSESVNTIEKLRHEIETLPVESAGQAIAFTVSFGLCACAPTPFTEQGQQRDMQGLLEELLKCADVCLYQAKKEGRNRVVHDTNLFNPDSLGTEQH